MGGEGLLCLALKSVVTNICHALGGKASASALILPESALGDFHRNKLHTWSPLCSVPGRTPELFTYDKEGKEVRLA